MMRVNIFCFTLYCPQGAAAISNFSGRDGCDRPARSPIGSERDRARSADAFHGKLLGSLLSGKSQLVGNAHTQNLPHIFRPFFLEKLNGTFFTLPSSSHPKLGATFSGELVWNSFADKIMSEFLGACSWVTEKLSVVSVASVWGTLSGSKPNSTRAVSIGERLVGCGVA